MLSDPEAHEALVEDSWDEDRVRAAIRTIVADAEEAFDELAPNARADSPRMQSRRSSARAPPTA